MDARASTETATMQSGQDITPQRSLKVKRSLSRLFSGSSRKSSRSRPPSPTADGSNTPITPPLPANCWPLTPKSPKSPTSPQSPDHALPPLPLHAEVEKILASIPQPERPWRGVPPQLQDGSEGAARLEPSVIGRRRRKTDTTASSTSGPRSRTSSDAASALTKSESGSIMRTQSGEKSPPTDLPINRKQRSMTGLRMPPGFSSIPRGRGASVTIPSNKTSPSIPQSSRPSTSGGDTQSKRPTGKRKQHETPHGHDGAGSSTPVVEDFPFAPQRPWQAMYNQDEVRSSFRSALTTGSSSHVETTSTERSSIVTKGTSVTESTIDPHSRPGSKAGGMTVDDYIDMYAAGFADDAERDLDDMSRGASISIEEERRRSMRIAEAISDDMGSQISSQRPSTSRASISSNAIVSGRALLHDSRSPPPIMPPTTLRDQYGFLKANHYITVTQYDLWNSEYLPSQERRTRKWIAYMRDQNLPAYQPRCFPSRSPKTHRFILKGIPPAWRGAAWFHYAGGESYLSQHPHLYSNLLTHSDLTLSENDKESIERDLHRTFPDNIHFKPASASNTTTHCPADEEPPLLASLRRVLRAFATHAPKIGYCQSLNFLTGLLLLFLPEEKAFIMLHLISTSLLPGTHDLSLEGANIDLWVLMVALKSTYPAIWAKVGAAGSSPTTPGLDDLNMPSTKLPPISLCTTSWFMSLFIGTLPIESVLRVWDILFYDGPRTLFRTALAIFKLGEKRIAELKDDMELFQVVQGLPRGMLDASGLMRAAQRKGGVEGGWVEGKRRERRLWYQRERARVASEVLGVVVPPPREEAGQAEGVEGGGGEGAGRMRRRNSIWQRKRSVVVRA